ncbi:NfeD family protein [Planctomycetota bacterium]
MDAIQDFLKPELIWFLIGLVLLIAEFIIPGLVIFFFGIGAWVVAFICIVTDLGFNTQLLIFIGTSVLSLLLLRRWLKGIFHGHTTAKQELTQDLQEYVGERAVVKATISPQHPGKVELHGTDWSATADQEIAAGTQVEIIEKDNLTLKVRES